MRVLLIVRMVPRAMCLGTHSRPDSLSRVTPSRVFCMRYRLQVIRRAAIPNLAQVVKLQSLRNRTHHKFVGVPMCIHMPSPTRTELCVSIMSMRPMPPHASVFIRELDSRVEIRLNRLIASYHVTSAMSVDSSFSRSCTSSPADLSFSLSLVISSIRSCLSLSA